MLDLLPFTSRIGSLLDWEPVQLFGNYFTSSPVNVEYKDDHVYVSADMPGVDVKDLDLTYENGTLSVSGKRGDQVYRFAVDIGNDIDPDKIEAQLDKGVLTISAEKKEQAKPRKIALKGASSQNTLESGEAKTT